MPVKNLIRNGFMSIFLFNSWGGSPPLFSWGGGDRPLSPPLGTRMVGRAVTRSIYHASSMCLPCNLFSSSVWCVMPTVWKGLHRCCMTDACCKQYLCGRQTFKQRTHTRRRIQHYFGWIATNSNFSSTMTSILSFSAKIDRPRFWQQYNLLLKILVQF